MVFFLFYIVFKIHRFRLVINDAAHENVFKKKGAMESTIYFFVKDFDGGGWLILLLTVRQYVVCTNQLTTFGSLVYQPFRHLLRPGRPRLSCTDTRALMYRDAATAPTSRRSRAATSCLARWLRYSEVVDTPSDPTTGGILVSETSVV